MKEACKCALRDFMMERLTQVRFEKKLTQAKFAELLMLDTRSYAAIEKGEYGCCALTLVMYLLYCCDDIDGFFDELRPRIMQVIEAEEKNVSYQKKSHEKHSDNIKLGC
ncbi:MAG: helix-turn-helix domain-containing protein [Clostridiales bacterium]|nr:helix-turn-helix domain-containing protein [Clostridiales bacterium]